MSGHEGLRLVLFSLGRVRCAIEARRVAASTPIRPGGNDADDQDGWQQGWRLFGLQELGREAGRNPEQWLDLRWPGGEGRLAVWGPLDLVSLPPAAVHPVPVLLAARCRLRGLRAIVVAPGLSAQALPLLDPCGVAGA